MQTAGCAGTVIGFVIGGLMIAITSLSYGFTIRALPLTGSEVAFSMAALGRTHAFNCTAASKRRKQRAICHNSA